MSCTPGPRSTVPDLPPLKPCAPVHTLPDDVTWHSSLPEVAVCAMMQLHGHMVIFYIRQEVHASHQVDRQPDRHTGAGVWASELVIDCMPARSHHVVIVAMKRCFQSTAPGSEITRLPSIISREPSSLSIENVKLTGATPGMLMDPASRRYTVGGSDMVYLDRVVMRRHRAKHNSKTQHSACERLIAGPLWTDLENVSPRSIRHRC